MARNHPFLPPVCGPMDSSPSLPKLTKAQKVKRAERLVGKSIGNGRIYLHKVLGHGSFGVVIHAYGPRDERTGRFKEYAVKCMCKLMSIKEHILAADEIQIHRKISGHPNVLPFVEILQDDLWFYLVLEYCPGGDLFKEIVHHRKYYGNDQLIKKVYCQILDAVEYCHARSIYHRDLKPENCLVKDDGETVMVMDFGLATEKKWCHEWGCGSRFYMAPEVFGANREPYSAALADVWALGVILVNLVTGRNPWRKAMTGDSVYDNFCRDPNALQMILPISDELNFLLRRIFVEPKYRPSIAEIREAVMQTETFLQADSPQRQIWQETLDRDREALLNQQPIQLHAEPLLPMVPEGAVARTTGPYPGRPAEIDVRRAAPKDSAVNGTSHMIPRKVLNWREVVADERENHENPGQFDEAAPSWSSGPSPRNTPPRFARDLGESASVESRPFPVTPQMPTNFAEAPAMGATLSPSQANRRGSIRRKLFSRNSALFDDTASEELTFNIVTDNFIDEAADMRHVTLGQKVKHLMHRSVRALNSRAALEPID